MKEILRVHYTKTIYPRWTIERAKRDYASICKIEISADASGNVCAFFDSVAPLELTAAEFSNYLIEMVNSKRNDSL